MTKKVELNLGRSVLSIETGKMAKQADGAVVVTLGGTVVLVTAVAKREAQPDAGFFPLTCEYQEKTYAAGRIPGGYFKREGRPTEKEILSSRLMDRPIRPLFPEGFYNEVQVMALVLSSDGENDSDVLAMTGASAALSLSSIPFLGPVGTVRVGMINNEFILNPTFKEVEESDLDIVIAASKHGVIMVEAGANELSEEVMLKAIKFGFDHIQPIIKMQEELVSKCGKTKMKPELKKLDENLLNSIKSAIGNKVNELLKIPSKDTRVEALFLFEKEMIEKFSSPDGFSEGEVKHALEKIEEETARKIIFDERVRVDGRKFNEIRPITSEVGVLPRTHGSSLFTRGQTQSLSIATLGTTDDEQTMETLEGELVKKFMLHYNFPSFSVGEVKPVRGPGRREIGHGALAERAIKPMLPNRDSFPYTIRLVSEILESNGSSSMATVCAGTLALMDAGVPIKSPVSGIAMGLIQKGNDYVILTDIGGIEDHFGDMDFKVAGTSKGITALQMDIKIENISFEILEKALAEALVARVFILNKMSEAISAPRGNLSKYAPRIVSFKISTDKIRDVIGSGGKIIKKIIEDTKAEINIEDDGTVQVASNNEESLNKAIDIIRKLTEDVEIGKVYLGKVKRIEKFGAFCEILPGKDGLVHVSELSDKYVKNVDEVVKIGDEIMVKVIEIDQQGRVNLSRKKAIEPSEKDKNQS